MTDNNFLQFGKIILYNPSKFGTEFDPGFEGSFDNFNIKFKRRIEYLQTIPMAVPEYLERNLSLKKVLKDFRRSLKNSSEEYIFSYCYSAPDPSRGIIVICENPNFIFVREKSIIDLNDYDSYRNYVIIYGKKKYFSSWIRMSIIERKNLIEKYKNKYFVTTTNNCYHNL